MGDQEGDYDEELRVIRKVIDRKLNEIGDLEKSGGNEKLIEYLSMDVSNYKAVISDMEGEELSLDALVFDDILMEELDELGILRTYMDGLKCDDMEDELEADGFRCDYIENVFDDLYWEIGFDALGNRKMVKALMRDDLAAMLIGEIVMHDEELSELFDIYVNKNKRKRRDREHEDKTDTYDSFI